MSPFCIYILIGTVLWYLTIGRKDIMRQASRQADPILALMPEPLQLLALFLSVVVMILIWPLWIAQIIISLLLVIFK